MELSWCDHLCQDDNTGAPTFDDRDVGGEFAVDFHDLDADRHTIVDVHNCSRLVWTDGIAGHQYEAHVTRTRNGDGAADALLALWEGVPSRR